MIGIVSSLHDLLIGFHAITVCISFFGGCILLYSREYRFDRKLFRLYLWSLVGMIAFLLMAMITEWTAYSGTERTAFTGLLGLGAYMLYRGFSARTLLKTQADGWSETSTHHIRFTLISLYEGFIVVSALNAQTPVWLVGLLAILGIVVGRRMIDTVAELEIRGDVEPS